MSAASHQPANATTNNAGLCAPHPAATHQGAGDELGPVDARFVDRFVAEWVVQQQRTAAARAERALAA